MLFQSKQPTDDGDLDQVVLFDHKVYFHAGHYLERLHHVSQMPSTEDLLLPAWNCLCCRALTVDNKGPKLKHIFVSSSVLREAVSAQTLQKSRSVNYFPQEVRSAHTKCTDDIKLEWFAITAKERKNNPIKKL